MVADLEVKEIIDRLNGLVGEAPGCIGSMVPLPSTSDRIAGSIAENGLHLMVLRRPWNRGGYLPRIVGTFSSSGGRTHIRLVSFVSPIDVFVVFALGALATGAGAAHGHLTAIPMAVALAVHASLSVVPFDRERRRVEQRFQQILGAEPCSTEHVAA